MSFFSSFSSDTSAFDRKPLRNARRRRGRSPWIQRFESRQLLAADAVADDLVALSDEFTDVASIASWQRVNQVENWNADQLQTWDINQTQPGRMVMS